MQIQPLIASVIVAMSLPAGAQESADQACVKVAEVSVQNCNRVFDDVRDFLNAASLNASSSGLADNPEWLASLAMDSTLAWSKVSAFCERARINCQAACGQDEGGELLSEQENMVARRTCDQNIRRLVLLSDQAGRETGDASRNIRKVSSVDGNEPSVAMKPTGILARFCRMILFLGQLCTGEKGDEPKHDLPLFPPGIGEPPEPRRKDK